MHILLKIDDFLDQLFPFYKLSGNNLDVLKNEITQYYSVGIFQPNVRIEGEFILVDIDTPGIRKHEAEYQKVVQLCEKGLFNEALPLLQKIIHENPTNSEYHRIYGQILSEQGHQEDAINALIDALRWDPKNGYALLMMGNIYGRYKDDVATAMTFYNQVLTHSPSDYIAMNNIGAFLLQLHKYEEAAGYFEKAFAINDQYPNTTYGLAYAYHEIGSPLIAFDFAIKSLKSCKSSSDQLYRNSYSLAATIAEAYCDAEKGNHIFEGYKAALEKKAGLPIRAEADATIATAAKIEFAENYNRDFHFIKYKPVYEAVAHLMMHELVHLDFMTDARAVNSNMLFTAGMDMRLQFKRDYAKDMRRLAGTGMSEESIAGFMDALYDGICNQIFNAPTDLFIEDYLYSKYEALRPYQFLSLHRLIEEGKNAVIDKRVVQYSPTAILSASKVLNMLNAIQFKDLFGADLLKAFGATLKEQKQAEALWEEYLDYRADKEPGEEYEIIQHWGEDLGLEKYFQLIDEQDFRKRPKNVDSFLESLDKDPLGLDQDTNLKEREMNQFQVNEESKGTNPAVMMYMVDALGYFEQMGKDKIKAIAFDIAMLGTQGISPEEGNVYRVPTIEGKEFSGYHLLAYYYVSWKLAVPEMLGQLGLPFDDEYKLAEQMFQSKK
ncbi:tetratricopeptide repeat protein [Lacibacter sp. H407]|uniref:tetratricopeptide repeat protein n=1 Tax=Lacibacter sp. H407 TaxID=3133423 RepID=UPI0030BAC2F4